MARHYQQGKYTPVHPEKYVGDITKIRYMSSWELELHKFFDNNPNVLRWGSECIAIPYIKPTDKKVHRYYPDYWVEYKNKAGQIIQEIIEVKPLSQTKVSRRRNPASKLYEDLTYAINIAKWQQAKQWCDKHGMVFRIVTENSIFK